MKFYLLASGSKGNCCVIENRNSRIVIDCGTTKKYLTQCLNEINIPLNSLQGMLITHNHSDHIKQLKMFRSIPTYSEFELDVEEQVLIQANQVFDISSLKIQSIRLSHDASCLGYIIQDEASKLVYITDTGYLKEEYYEVLANADYYIFESNHDVEMLMKTQRPSYVKQRIINDYGHLCNEDCAKHLGQLIGNNTKQVVLAHISEEGNTRQQAIDVLENQLKMKQIARDQLTIMAAPQFEITRGGQDD